MDEEGGEVGFDAAPADPREPQPSRDGIVPLKQQPPVFVNPGELFSPFSGDDPYTRLPHINLPAASPPSEFTMGPDSMVFSDAPTSNTDGLPQPQTPSLARPPAQDEAGLTFGAGGVGPDRGLKYPWELPDDEFAELLNFGY
jgi:hypothetical protein